MRYVLIAALLFASSLSMALADDLDDQNTKCVNEHIVRGKNNCFTSHLGSQVCSKEPDHWREDTYKSDCQAVNETWENRTKGAAEAAAAQTPDQQSKKAAKDASDEAADPKLKALRDTVRKFKKH